MTEKKQSAALTDPHLMTAEEIDFTGGTPDIIPGKDEEWKWYIPQAVLEGKMTKEQAREARREKEYFDSGQLAYAFDGVNPVRFSVSEIDIRSGQTKHSPEVVGIWNGQKVLTFEGRNLTQELYDFCARNNINLHRRKPSGEKERELSASSEQRG